MSPLSPSLPLSLPSRSSNSDSFAHVIATSHQTKLSMCKLASRTERGGGGGGGGEGELGGEGGMWPWRRGRRREGEGTGDPDDVEREREEGRTVCDFITTLITTILAEHTSFASLVTTPKKKKKWSRHRRRK